MPSPPDHDWFLSHDAAARDHSGRRSRRRALLASVAIHALLLSVLLGLGYRYRYRAVPAINGAGSDVPQEPAALGGLLRGRIAWQGGCEPIGDSMSTQLFRALTRRGSRSFPSDSVTALLRPTASSQLRAVESDSLCQRAAQAIDHLVRPLAEFHPRRIFLFRAGDHYVAVDTALQRSARGDVYLLDSSVSRVVGSSRR